MPIPRFFCDFELYPETNIVLPGNILHHAKRVLRLREGSSIILFNGRGGEYPATLRLDNKKLIGQLHSFIPREVELKGTLTLIQGLLISDKMDQVIGKAVELGTARVIPVTTQRSIPKLKDIILRKRILHWRRIIHSASEQCGRNRLMKIEQPISLEEWLEKPLNELCLLCHPRASRKLEEVLAPCRTGLPRLTLMVGPEGGWSDNEITQILNKGIKGVYHGHRILRTENASTVLMSASSTLLGWV